MYKTLIDRFKQVKKHWDLFSVFRENFDYFYIYPLITYKNKKIMSYLYGTLCS